MQSALATDSVRSSHSAATTTRPSGQVQQDYCSSPLESGQALTRRGVCVSFLRLDWVLLACV